MYIVKAKAILLIINISNLKVKVCMRCECIVKIVSIYVIYSDQACDTIAKKINIALVLEFGFEFKIFEEKNLRIGRIL